MSTVRTLLVVVAAHHWLLYQMDFKMLFSMALYLRQYICNCLQGPIFLLDTYVSFVVLFMVSSGHPVLGLSVFAMLCSRQALWRVIKMLLYLFALHRVVMMLGLIIVTIQARTPSLRPISTTQTPSKSQEAMLHIGLYAMAFGVGGIIANLPAHGADQFDSSKKNLISSYFNWFFFCLCSGGMLGVTFLVWIQENKGWVWGLAFSTGALAISLVVFASGFTYYRHKVPSGSPLTSIFKVLVYSARNWNVKVQATNTEGPARKYHSKFRFLEKATTDDHVTPAQVDEAKSFFSLLPIFASTILMSCCLAQLQTFSVQQGKAMNTKLAKGFHIPPASLTSIPLMVMLLSVPLYDLLSSLTTKKLTKINFVLKPLKRIGIGLILASASMTVASLVEIKRRNASVNGTQLSVFWLGWQYLLLGVSDMFTLAGMLEFFYSEAPDTMRSMCTSLSWCSTSMGYFLSSVLVEIVEDLSSRFGSEEWLGGKSLNDGRLELFYGLLAVLNFVNFLNYVFWAKWYEG
ncbi:protein NRT1/ PTR FAMILY 4.2-like [Asparagus officinalis]|uniref:protein NRT1/ PTR FAMILY 4.2-like n=1 Tax=Asparagus officinalis TaxID=4686 RepID=UPI00098E7AD9|nr:protein NRT1/ PTR FAMILY 4.2-like [Asparagus officinalis]